MNKFPRTIYEPEHEQFRDVVRRFCQEKLAPHREEWEEAKRVPPEIWREAGSLGMLNGWLPEKYGGVGEDTRFDLIVCEELGRACITGPGFSLHSLVITPYIHEYGTEKLKTRLLPRLVSGDSIAAIGMTEPSAGSDLSSIRTTAVREGDGWRVNGQKTFITNGHNADVLVAACVTDPGKGAKGISLLVLEAEMEGYSKGKSLRKIGQHASDTAELFFDNVYVPDENFLGEPNNGFFYMMEQLPLERMSISVQCQSRAEAIFDLTVDYTSERKAFGKRVLDFQNTRFALAGLKAELLAGQAFCDALIKQSLEGKLDSVQASAGKLWHSEMLGRVVDTCVQLHGGYGYMEEYTVARAFIDARLERIYAGTSEIMKEIIGRSLS